MHNSLLLGISVGESFAEYSLLLDSKPLAQKRVLLSRESLKTSLAQFIGEQTDAKVSQAFISLRVPKKLMDYKLSGAVAHVCTEGFENWLELNNKFHHSLTNKDLIFSVRERILANGQIETQLSVEDLSAVAAKLELVNCKKVCLHFLHANMNPTHLQTAQNFFLEKGIEVYCPKNSDNKNEVSRWNRNALNATVAGVFEDLKKDLLSALEAILPAENIFFLSSEGHLFQNTKDEQVGCLFSSSTALGLALENPDTDILYLGLEGFHLICRDDWDNTWRSPWGEVELRHKKVHTLSIQPTLGIRINDLGHFDFNQTVESWEPGPMFLGRGQKMTLIDLWAENAKFASMQGLEDRVNATGVQRFKTSLLTLAKISKARETDASVITKQLQSLAMQRLAMETYLNRTATNLLVTGPLAAVFANAFKKDSKIQVATNEYIESQSIAAWGAKALKESL